MGLIKAAIGAIGSTVADTFEDYIYCAALDNSVLMQRGYPKSSGGAGSFATGAVISDGSRIAVNDGQFLIVVENGKIADFTAEQGGYIFRTEAEPSMFCGQFGDKLKNTFNQLLERFAFGGIAANDQRAYFVNTKEIINNKFGFGNVPFRDGEFNMTIMLQGFGAYTYRITDPLMFYANLCGNTDSFGTANLDSQMKSEIKGGLLPALGRLSADNICYDKIPIEAPKLAEILNEELSDIWEKARGITITSLTFANIMPDEESVDKIREMQESRVYSADTRMLGARVGAAQANAMESAAENPSGSVNGFVGMSMAQQSGGVDPNRLLSPNPPAPASYIPNQPAPSPIPTPVAPNQSQPSANYQTTASTIPTPVNQTQASTIPTPVSQAPTSTDSPETWICECGSVNDDMFCPECGKKRVIKKNYTCPSCGRVIENRETPPKFCPKCGSKF